MRFPAYYSDVWFLDEPKACFFALRISLLTPFNPPFEVNTTLYVFLAMLRETLSDRIALPFQGVKEVEFD